MWVRCIRGSSNVCGGCPSTTNRWRPANCPRAARRAVDNEVRVVFGLEALCYAIGETEQPAPDIADEGTARRERALPIAGRVGYADVPPSRIGGEAWTMADASESGCRLTARTKEAPAKLGDLLAIREGTTWSLGVVRRMQRTESDDVSLGVEIIARRLVPVLLRTWTSSSADVRSGAG